MHLNREVLLSDQLEGLACSVRKNGQIYNMEIATTAEQLQEAKQLDDLVFQSQVGVSLEEMFDIANNGAVILLRDSNGRLVGESQVITSPIPAHTQLASDEAYDYGTGIHPSVQNHGLAQVLFEGQSKVAQAAGKSKNTLTVRAENGSSIRGRIKAGYYIVGYHPTYYGPLEENGARLIMEKNHKQPRKIWATTDLVKRLLAQEVKVLDNVSSVEDEKKLDTYEFLGVRVTTGDEVDYEAHRHVPALLRKNFMGIGILKSVEAGIEDSQSMIVFQRNTE